MRHVSLVRVHSLSLALTASLACVACGNEPLAPIALGAGDDRRGDTQSNDSADDADSERGPNDDPNDDPSDDSIDDDGDTDENDVPNDDPVIVTPNEPDPIVCVDGSSGDSYRDTLPPLPNAVLPSASLGAGSGVAEATCAGEAAYLTDPTTHDDVTSELAHVGGRYYFEATVEEYTEGWSQVGVFADPATSYLLEAYFQDAVSAAGTYVSSGDSTISFAVDLDAGVAFEFLDGQLQREHRMLLLPGVGAFHAAGISMIGNRIRFNYGSEPFRFALPEGYGAWSSGAEDAAGNCVSDVAAPAPAAPIVTMCDSDASGCSTTTFQSSVDEDTALVVLGVYDSGSVSGWTWDIDAEGNIADVDTGATQSGSINVNITRPGSIALVLSAYEPTAWTLNIGPDTTLASVSIYGMHMQTVDGLPNGVPFELHTICLDGDGGRCSAATGEQFPIAPHQWPFDIGGGDTQGFIEMVEADLCLPLKLFAGSYEARGFLVQ
jgi:hypothetical protein